MNAVDKFTENIREIKNDVADVREIKSMTYELDKLIADTTQTDYEIAKAIVHKAIDNTAIAEDVYPDLRQKLHDTVENTPQTEINKTIPLNEWLPFKEYVLEMDGEGKPLSFRIIPMQEYKAHNSEPQTDCGWK